VRRRPSDSQLGKTDLQVNPGFLNEKLEKGIFFAPLSFATGSGTDNIQLLL
jgi:hypothetical protein